MKKIISALVIFAVIVAVLSLAACGDNTESDIKNEMSTMKDEGSSVLDDLNSAASDIDSAMTQNGNVTDSDSSTGLFETMTTESTAKHNSTTAPDDILQ